MCWYRPRGLERLLADLGNSLTNASTATCGRYRASAMGTGAPCFSGHRTQGASFEVGGARGIKLFFHRLVHLTARLLARSPWSESCYGILLILGPLCATPRTASRFGTTQDVYRTLTRERALSTPQTSRARLSEQILLTARG
jgi:hypothetical protein